jgi:Skp family chaperone for outer membrane proteins
MACVAALGVAVYFGNHLRAQTPPGGTAPAAAPRTRIAMLNLAYVIKSYAKWDQFQKNFKVDYKAWDDKVNAKMAQKDAAIKEAQAPGTPAEKRDKLVKDVKVFDRDIEDLKAEGQKVLGAKSDEQMVVIYKEVRDAATRYALSHNFDLVLHYNDVTTQADFDSPNNIARKMNAGALMPLYVANGMDISYDVVNALNAAYTANSGGRPATGTPGTGTPGTGTPGTGTPGTHQR